MNIATQKLVYHVELHVCVRAHLPSLELTIALKVFSVAWSPDGKRLIALSGRKREGNPEGPGEFVVIQVLNNNSHSVVFSNFDSVCIVSPLFLAHPSLSLLESHSVLAGSLPSAVMIKQ